MTKCRKVKPSEKYPPVICPKCKGIAESLWTRYGVRHSCCGVVSWGNDGLIGKLSEFHSVRKEVYAEFSNLWNVYGLTIDESYALLAIDLRIPRTECLMSKMSLEMLQKVPFSYIRILKSLAPSNLAAFKLLKGLDALDDYEIISIEGYR